jgi:hypothetical protein
MNQNFYSGNFTENTAETKVISVKKNYRLVNPLVNFEDQQHFKKSSDRRFLLAVNINGLALTKLSTGVLKGRPVLKHKKRAFSRGYLWSDSRLLSGYTKYMSNSFTKKTSL